MDYEIVENELNFNEDGSSNPIFHVVHVVDGTIVYYGVTLEECENYIRSRYDI